MQPEISILNNGLRIVSLKYPQFETVSLGIWVNTGSAYERENMNGISHFLEHMVFKGTAGRSAAAISEDIETWADRPTPILPANLPLFMPKC